MSFGMALIERLRAISRKDDPADLFDLRLQRARLRESRSEVKLVLFRSQPSPQEA